jgi:ATP-dependent protease ClpP protease subunit
VDGSHVTATNNYSVILAGTAEQNAKALNIVNAAGGMVANGLNIARTSNLVTTPTLTQVNSISQTR